MSVINKMLQELDKRHARPMQDALPRPDAARLTQQVRSVTPSGMASGVFWGIVAGSVFLMLAWFIWVTWKSAPTPLVNDRTDLSVSPPRPAVPAAVPAAVPPAVPAAMPVSVPAAVPETARVHALRLATELASPSSAPSGQGGRSAAVPGTKEAAGATRHVAEPRVQSSERNSPRTDADTGRIDKRIDATPRQRAEGELRRAMANVRQGRIAEGVDGLKAALLADPGYEVARQTLVALLLDAKRTGEAAGILQEGLAVNPANAGFAMLLARLTVDRGDTQGALALLQRHAPAARQDADYRAFLGALFQRLGRHAEAIAEYEFSVQVRPDHGAWWAGLGISQEALERTRDAGESYRRAKASGNLNADLSAYVDRRLRQMP